MPEITALYAGLTAILFFVLSTLASVERGKTGIVIGHGDNSGLRLAIRRFGNLAEYGTMAMLVLLMLELTGHPAAWLHTFGATFILLRLLYPLVLFGTENPGLPLQVGRFIAAAGTALLLLAGGLALIF